MANDGSGTPPHTWYLGKQSNPYKPANKTQEPDRMPMIADRDPAGNKVTTNYPMKQDGPMAREGGTEIDQQLLRGYVHNQATRKINTRDGNQIGLSGTSTIREITPTTLGYEDSIEHLPPFAGGQSGSEAGD